MKPYHPSGSEAIITTHDAKGYRIITVKSDLTLNSDISHLTHIISEALAAGMRHFGLSFTPDSYLSTRTISVLVNCFEAIRDAGGSLTIINPNEDILDVLGMIDIDRAVRFCVSEEALDVLEPSGNNACLDGKLTGDNQTVREATLIER